MIWKDYLKLSEIASYSKLARPSRAPLGGTGLNLQLSFLWLLPRRQEATMSSRCKSVESVE